MGAGWYITYISRFSKVERSNVATLPLPYPSLRSTDLTLGLGDRNGDQVDGHRVLDDYV